MFWEVHTALDGPRINQSNREFLSRYTIIQYKRDKFLCSVFFFEGGFKVFTRMAYARTVDRSE